MWRALQTSTRRLPGVAAGRHARCMATVEITRSAGPVPDLTITPIAAKVRRCRMRATHRERDRMS